MNITDFQKRFLWVLVILFILILWITFPLIFKEWVFSLLVKPPFTPESYASLGPIGDIFGGLTAFFTSATLIIVMYSAYLQRQANKDAREAIAEQLKQAREATAEQLRQAKEATAEQLKQARESTIQQLDLAQSTHEAQIQETKNSFFTSQFYSLLNYKNERIKTLTLRNDLDRTIVGYEIFTILRSELIQNIAMKFKENMDDLNVDIIRTEYENIISRLNNGHRFYEIFSYFEIYTSLFNLVDSADIDNEQKNFFLKLIRQSATPSEQITLFYIAPIWERLYKSLEGKQIFISFSPTNVEKFALKFYNKDYFCTSEWYVFFDEQQNPA
ncbi:hypothetical protein BFR80_016540 [Acinetobacter pittii]|uniref:cell envelope integrity protein TolA n=1 Tax=Acinetobacter pittii TaxID=48296 RepID=UPI0008382F75|nr:hypothetical protein [Acinetobacter pittii]MCK0925682.1 hypothetical protein [Acinetobacter pittii]